MPSALLSTITLLMIIISLNNSLNNFSKFKNVHKIMRVFCSSKDSSTGMQPTMTTTGGTIIPTSLNLKGLKNEINRKSQRLFKKAVQANERISKLSVDLEKSESIVDTESVKESIELVKFEAAVYSERLKEVKKLEEDISTIKSISDPRLIDMLSIVHKYNITDTPPPVQERGPKKIKTKKMDDGPRLPYIAFESLDNIEIRVGRRAEDNDELSCNPEFRDGPDWWLHVAGHPGSHVVIRNHDDELPLKFKETLKDAAVLAAKNSKAAGSNSMLVTYTRCRNVSKSSGAKAGLVYLKGDVATIKVNLKAEQERLARLEAQK